MERGRSKCKGPETETCLCVFIKDERRPKWMEYCNRVGYAVRVALGVDYVGPPRPLVRS